MFLDLSESHSHYTKQQLKSVFYYSAMMEFLWQKESANENSPYRDLFANIENDYPEFVTYDLTSMSAQVYESTMAKKNAFSDQRRKDGNEKFKEEKWEEALNIYHECVCLAEINTENVAFAYGNRSACYFELKMYGKCLVDIELALNENCPERLKIKLEARKADCLKLLSSDVVAEKLDVNLSYEANKNFPFMANVLKIQKNDEFGRHVIAKCDIPAGQTVVFDDNFVSFTKANNYITKNNGPMKCLTCNKIASNPIPCLKCTLVMFCNTECRDANKIHQMDCGAVYYMDDQINNKCIIQSVIAAVNLFPSIDELISFVEEAVTSGKLEIPKSVLDQQSKYRMFLTLWIPPKMEDFVPNVYKLFKSILRLEEIKKLFDSTTKQRFLMHLIGQHALVLLFNSIQGQMCVLMSLFSHSCAPNVQEIWIDNRTACITIRKIKKGEQLCLAYMTEETMQSQQKDHKMEIYSKFGFRCKCVKCENKLVHMKQIERDTYFLQINNANVDPKNKVQLQELITKCVALLNKYGHLQWSYQLDYISKRLGLFLGLFYYSAVEVK